MSSKKEARSWWKGLSIDEQLQAVENWKKVTKSEKKKTSIVLIASDDNTLETIYKELKYKKNTD